MKTIRSDKHPGLRVAPGRREPGLLVTEVAPELAEHLAAGERILSVDGHEIEDLLDFRYHAVFSDAPRLTVLGADGATREARVDAALLAGEALRFEPLAFKTCGNDCVFCFVKQMPPGLREDLYLMDEDYRLGFLYGNYTSMALIRDRELERIAAQRLSPVYVSVHATDMALRNRMLGLKRSRDITEVMSRLKRDGISIHAQIVLLPGWNDGAPLDRTLTDLAALYGEPGEGGVQSVGIVPVGLTDHRANLTPLIPFDRAGHARMVAQVERHQERFLETFGSRFAFLADEFYLGAERDLPTMEAYEELPLIDNGIGMARDFIDTVRGEMADWREPERPLRAVALTGRLGEALFRAHLSEPLNALPGFSLDVRPLENRLFGSGVTVSGLLPGEALLDEAVACADSADVVLLPPNILNANDLFLDDLSLDAFRARCPLPVCIPEVGLLDAVTDTLSSSR